SAVIVILACALPTDGAAAPVSRTWAQPVSQPAAAVDNLAWVQFRQAIHKPYTGLGISDAMLVEQARVLRQHLNTWRHPLVPARSGRLFPQWVQLTANSNGTYRLHEFFPDAGSTSAKEVGVVRVSLLDTRFNLVSTAAKLIPWRSQGVFVSYESGLRNLYSGDKGLGFTELARAMTVNSTLRQAITQRFIDTYNADVSFRLSHGPIKIEVGQQVSVHEFPMLGSRVLDMVPGMWPAPKVTKLGPSAMTHPDVMLPVGTQGQFDIVFDVEKDQLGYVPHRPGSISLREVGRQQPGRPDNPRVSHHSLAQCG
ncbi:MAG: hypothetical protein ACPG4T_09640, partial [Nannocystaceae bacterium]